MYFFFESLKFYFNNNLIFTSNLVDWGNCGEKWGTSPVDKGVVWRHFR
jgi:hypothetical protein